MSYCTSKSIVMSVLITLYLFLDLTSIPRINAAFDVFWKSTVWFGVWIQPIKLASFSYPSLFPGPASASADVTRLSTRLYRRNQGLSVLQTTGTTCCLTTSHSVSTEGEVKSLLSSHCLPDVSPTSLSLCF